jgi:membrane dipeptidase
VLRLLPLVLLPLSGCSAARPERTAPPEPPTVVRADLHLHFNMEDAAKPVFKGRTGDGAGLAASPGVILRNQVDIDTLHDAGVRLAVGTIWPPFRLRPNVDLRGESLRQLHLLRRFSERSPGMVLAGDSASARALVSRGYLTIIPALEGGEGLRTPQDVDLVYAAGARSVTLVHFGANAIGGAAYRQLPTGFFDPAGRSDVGLLPAGRAIVERLMELGMIIDLAHASDRTMQDVLALTEARGVPVIYSHTGARALHDSERNLGDALAVRIARGGGLIGLTVFHHYVKDVPGEAALPAHAHGTCDDVIAHWLHLAKQVGPEHLALGSDFNGFVKRPAAGGRCPQGLRHVGELPTLFGALVAAGFPAEALDQSGQRLLALWEAVEAAADPVARARAARLPLPEVTPLESPL